jgi:hypothetical protein
VIKTLEAQVCQFLLGCKCPVSRFLPGWAKDLSAPLYNCITTHGAKNLKKKGRGKYSVSNEVSLKSGDKSCTFVCSLVTLHNQSVSCANVAICFHSKRIREIEAIREENSEEKPRN